MDWLSELEPIPYTEVEQIDPTLDAGRLTAWLILAAVALIVAALWYRQRVFRRSFWCATVGRDIEVRLRLGCVLSCSAFEDPTAIACARRCLDRSFRVQWPPALPVLTRPRGTARVT
jgi:hypothetical protein